MNNHQENLTAYLDGELPEAERKELEAALEKDAALRASLEQLRGAVATLKALPEAQASAALRRAVLQQVEGPQTVGEHLKAFFTLPRLVPIAGVAAAALAVVVYTGNENAPADPEQLFVAQNMELLEDLDTLGLESPEDLDVVMNLDALEATP